MDFNGADEPHPALTPSAVGMIRALHDHDSSEGRTEESNGQQPVVFCPIASVSIAIRLKAFAHATNSALPGGAETLLLAHASNGDAACQMLADNLNLKDGGSTHDQG